MFQRSVGIGRRWCGAACVALSLVVTGPVEAQPFVPFAEFDAMSMAELANLQVKFTYIGARKRGFPSIAFTTPGRTLDMSLFTAYERPGMIYDDDEDVEAEFSASAIEMRAILDGVATLPAITAGDVEDGAVLSFALVNTINGMVKGFESVVARPTGRQLFEKVLVALQGNGPASEKLVGFACAMGMAPGTSPPNLAPQVIARLSGVRHDRGLDQYVGILRVKNSSAATIQGPIVVAFRIVGSAQVVSPDGFSCRTSPKGLPFVRVLTTGSLAPGATINKQISFTNPDRVKIVLTSIGVFGSQGP